MSQFGKKRLSDFHVDPTYVNINHGSYGYCPKVVLDEKRRLELQCELNTEKWFRKQSEELINQMRAYVATKIHCPTKNVYFVQNATDGINSLLKSLKWQTGDVILLPNIAYACVRKTVVVLQERYGIQILDINFTVQDFKSSEQIQLKIEDFVNSYPKKIKLAIFDHISSVPSVIFPIELIQQFLQEKNIPLFVDGAHAINHIDVDFSEIKPAAYFSNFHKWAFAPKNAAFLYISDKYLDVIKPALTGNFYGQGPAREYYWTGTRDLTSYICVKKGFQYSESFGTNASREYTYNLAKQAAKTMADIWGTSLLTNDPRLNGNTINIQVPVKDSQIAQDIAMKMLYEDNCFPAFYQFDGKIWVRISAQIYNQLSDYEYAARTFLKRLKSYSAEKIAVQSKKQDQK